MIDYNRIINTFDVPPVYAIAPETVEAFGLTVRIKMRSGETFLHSFIFADSGQRHDFQRWLMRNPDKGSWLATYPETLKDNVSAQRYVNMFADML